MGRGFKGEYNHTVDAKGRLIVPAKFREALGETFVVTKGLDGCLFLYPNEVEAVGAGDQGMMFGYAGNSL